MIPIFFKKKWEILLTISTTKLFNKLKNSEQRFKENSNSYQHNHVDLYSKKNLYHKVMTILITNCYTTSNCKDKIISKIIWNHEFITYDQKLQNNFYQIKKLIKFKLCGATVESNGRHGLACKKQRGRYMRHEEVNKLIKRGLYQAKIPSTLEPIGLFRWPHIYNLDRR